MWKRGKLLFQKTKSEDPHGSPAQIFYFAIKTNHNVKKCQNGRLLTWIVISANLAKTFCGSNYDYVVFKLLEITEIT